jgi:plastocyanin
MRIRSTSFQIAAAVAMATVAGGGARRAEAQGTLDVSAHLEVPSSNAKWAARNAVSHPPAVAWLTPLDGQSAPDPDTSLQYTLLQKNKEFLPHLLVVPVGSVVHFPNADPFFHNVFSLFNGRRFDLGLYETGSTREVTFGREGISYIFCNIHPQMSAVVIALSTPFYAVAEPHGLFELNKVPPGDYLLQVWVQGADPTDLKALTRKVSVSADHADLGVIPLPHAPHPPSPHTNKYGKPYDTKDPAVY